MSIVKDIMLHQARVLRGKLEDDILPNLERGLGLCAFLLDKPKYRDKQRAHSTLAGIMEQWPEFSGSLSFPVPAPPNWQAPRGYSTSAAAIFLTTGDLYVGEYGAARMRLLSFIIDTLTKELVE